MGSDDDLQEIVLPLAKIDPEQIGRVGGKAANLARLKTMGFRVPNGFVITSSGFERIFREIPEVQEAIMTIERSDDYEEMLELSIQLQSLVSSYEIPNEIVDEIRKEFHRLQTESRMAEYGFAVRSSANIEDRDDISFAGQAESVLCVTELDDLFQAVKKVWFSGFSPNAVIYLHTKGIPLSQMKMCVFVQEMIPAEVSGVTFTANVVTKNTEEMLINSTWGLGDTLVSGKIVPDTFILSKKPFSVKSKEQGTKEKLSKPELIDGCLQPTVQDTPQEKRVVFSLDDESVLQIAELGLEIEKRFGKPQDIEWCMQDDDIVILQSRPITTL